MTLLKFLTYQQKVEKKIIIFNEIFINVLFIKF